MRGRNLDAKRLHSDLELEEIEAFAQLDPCFGDVLLDGRIAEQPHRRDAGPRRPGTRDVDETVLVRAAGCIEQRHLDRRAGTTVAYERTGECCTMICSGVLADE